VKKEPTVEASGIISERPAEKKEKKEEKEEEEEKKFQPPEGVPPEEFEEELDIPAFLRRSH